MKRIIIDSTLTVKGADPLKVYYKRLNETFPEYGLTQDNSVITLIQSYGDQENKALTMVKIKPQDKPWITHEFVHNRFDLGRIIPTPTFNAGELPTVTGLPNSVELVKYMATKFNRAFTVDTIWCEIYGIDYAGGTSGKNWRMRAVWDSMFWYGEKLVWLHP